KFVKSYELVKESKNALNKQMIDLKDAEKKFKTAKDLYNKKEYLKATDALSGIILLGYDSPRHLYKEIVDMMKKTINNNDELDFAKLTYARAYVAYYNANYKEALNEWLKYISFKGETE
ncbi:MAG: hypothetical protein LBT07_00200, partial [Endomicrobium sp.]|nr:hypothetical protein [Endomicrobium sp.]